MCRSSRQALSKVVSRRLSRLSPGLLVLQAFWAPLVGCGLGCRAVGRDWHGMRFSADWDRSRQQGVEGARVNPMMVCLVLPLLGPAAPLNWVPAKPLSPALSRGEAPRALAGSSFW